VTVVGAVQDARKEVVKMRDLFPNLIVLGLNSHEETKMLLGPETALTAACHRIPKATPGVAWVLPDGAEPERVRAAYVSDADIAQMVATVAAQAPLRAVADPAEGEDPGPLAEAV
jgi:S-DNA-T family DNA segregation ATPase FtsK/SpoIIIE